MLQEGLKLDQNSIGKYPQLVIGNSDYTRQNGTLNFSAYNVTKIQGGPKHLVSLNERDSVIAKLCTEELVCVRNFN